MDLLAPTTLTTVGNEKKNKDVLSYDQDKQIRHVCTTHTRVLNSEKCHSKQLENVSVPQIAADPDSCNHFYKCLNGTLTHESCGNGLLFNEALAFRGAVHNHCSYNWNTDCGERPVDDTQVR